MVMLNAGSVEDIDFYVVRLDDDFFSGKEIHETTELECYYFVNVMCLI